MNDIVIPYLPVKSGELETCLILAERNFPHNKNYVVTDYEKVPGSDQSHANQILKLKWAIENLELTDDFYLMNDDMFILKPIKEVPYYFKGTVEGQYYRTSWLSYKRAIKNTLDYLDENALSYEMHIPMLFNKDKLYKLILEIVPLIKVNKCPLIRSTYGNVYKVGGDYMEDVKNIKDFEDKTFLSTDERSFNRAIGQYIRSQV